MTAHRIQLHGFWQVTTDDGVVRSYSRKFGRPRVDDAGERVWLVGEAGPGLVVLNGVALGVIEARAFAFDVTERLAARNEVVIASASELGEVAVEIRNG